MDPRGSADSHVRSYRADIDGLRAIAILAVVFYHLRRDMLPGGYLGVDVFFVISGYLITGIIWREAERGEFSIRRFYERRVRRIVPALLALLFVCTILSAVLLLPLDLQGFGKSTLATLAFSANIYFWRDSDYFSQLAEEKPLLHMWSLGVEEQFYILFPFLLAALARRPRRIALGVILALIVCSFALNVAANRYGAGTPAFYLLPTRAWELGLGALVALPAWPLEAPSRSRRAAGLFGLALVLLAVAGFSTGSAAPPALPAVAGASLVIWARHQNGIGRALLQSRPMLWVGLISYSLYLWHWPVIVFAKYWLVRDLTLAESVVAVALMFALAAGSYLWIEKPFRSQRTRERSLYVWSAGGAATVAVAAAAFLASGGLPGRLNAEAAVLNSAVGTHYRCGVADYMVVGSSRACAIALPSRDPTDADVVLLGNSHAQMYAPLVARLLKERGLTGLMVNVNGCLPSSHDNMSADCIAAGREQISAVVGLRRAKLVIIAFNWDISPDVFVDAQGRKATLDADDLLIDSIDPTIDELREAGKTVVLIGPLMVPGWEVASDASRALAFGRTLERPISASYAELQNRYGKAIAHFEQRRDITLVRPDEVQCASGHCDFIAKGQSLFSDSNHLAAGALGRFEKEFAERIPWPMARQ